eukprot:augustus_masked-scaffold_5-processed-gene-10.43-mRNA-1 protein AED:0.75 eAED:0.75 QI:0/-1/0/1/-1/1/1/0/451
MKLETVLQEAVNQGLLTSTIPQKTSFNAKLSDQSVSEVVSSVDSTTPCAFFYDVSEYKRSLKELTEAFPKHFFHAVAIKNNPVTNFLKLQKSFSTQFGAECASFGEVVQSLKVYEPNQIVFDSPCKTYEEIRASILLGLHINLDNLQELSLLNLAISEVGQEVFESKGAVVGLRINPLVGWGKIAELSVSTKKSKFGTIVDEEVIHQIAKNDFVTCVHVHTGSNGMDLEQLVMGARVAVDFALRVNEERGEKGINSRMTCIDIGGGLPKQFVFRYDEYAAQLEKKVPELFDGTILKVVTEFGSVLNERLGFFASRVQYTKENDENNVILVHGGSDVFVRNCYCPGKFVTYPYFILDKDGKNKKGDTFKEYDIAGPLCFSGDVLAKKVQLHVAEQNDILVVKNCGGNTCSLKNMHCSRNLPAIYGYQKTLNGVDFEVLKTQQNVTSTVSIWD